MEITKESIGELNELVKIQLQPADYREQVNAVIRKTRKSVQMPGFRPGHVPEGMVRKMYGKAILADELNKIVSESLEKFITENKISILGHPLPVKENGTKNDMDNPAEFEFKFELGLVPQFSLDIPPVHVFPFYEIHADDEKVETYMNDVRLKFGKHSNPEISDETSILYASFAEVDSENKPVENGISTSTTLAIDLVKDPEIKKRLMGLKKDDPVVIDLVKAMDNATEVGYMLHISKDKVAELKNNFELKVINVNKVEKADLNQEFFDKVYGKDAVKSEEEFREKLKAEIAAVFAVEADKKLQHDIRDELLHQFKAPLPDNFLKRWLADVNEKPVAPEHIEQEYSSYAGGMKWQLIENRIANENNIQVSKEEIENYAKQLIVNQFAQYGNSFLTDEMISDMVKRYISKEENVKSAYQSLAEKKVFAFLGAAVKKETRKVTYDEFLKILKEHKHHH